MTSDQEIASLTKLLCDLCENTEDHSMSEAVQEWWNHHRKSTPGHVAFRGCGEFTLAAPPLSSADCCTRHGSRSVPLLWEIDYPGTVRIHHRTGSGDICIYVNAEGSIAHTIVSRDRSLGLLSALVGALVPPAVPQ